MVVRARYQANIEKYRSMSRNGQRSARARYYEKLQQCLIDLNIPFKCCMCGENHPACLQFHHRNPDEKSFGILCNIKLSRSIEELKCEIMKCDILCANCHSKIHFNDKNGQISHSTKKQSISTIKLSRPTKTHVALSCPSIVTTKEEREPFPGQPPTIFCTMQT